MDESKSQAGSLQSDRELCSIGEAADLLKVSVQTLRLYEREGLIIPYRRGSKHRRYSVEDIERIRCLRRMLGEEKVSLAGIKSLLAMIPCWKIKDCPSTARESCPAFRQHSKPCWVISHRPWVCADANCRTCSVYTMVSDCQTLKRVISDLTISPGSL